MWKVGGCLRASLAEQRGSAGIGRPPACGTPIMAAEGRPSPTTRLPGARAPGGVCWLEMPLKVTSGRGPAGTLWVVGNVGEYGREPPTRVVGSCFRCVLGVSRAPREWDCQEHRVLGLTHHGPCGWTTSCRPVIHAGTPGLPHLVAAVIHGAVSAVCKPRWSSCSQFFRGTPRSGAAGSWALLRSRLGFSTEPPGSRRKRPGGITGVWAPSSLCASVAESPTARPAGRKTTPQTARLRPSTETEAPSRRRKRHPEEPGQFAVALVLICRTLGQLLPEHYDPDRRSLR